MAGARSRLLNQGICTYPGSGGCLLRVLLCGMWRVSYLRVLPDCIAPGARSSCRALTLLSPGLARAQLGSFKFQAVWDSRSPHTHLTLLLPG